MKDTQLGSYHERLNRVLDHLERNLDDELTLESLAGVACFSPHHFHRIFTGMVGESVKKHVRRLRLQRAEHRLVFTELPVTDIAFSAGYDSPEAFSRAFKRQYGLAPSRWREDALAGALETEAGPDRPRMGHVVASMRQGGITMEVKIQTLEPMRVAYVRSIGPYEQCEAAWNQLCGWAGPKGLLGPSTVFVGLSHDDPESTPADKIRYDACITVDESVEPEGQVGVKEIEAVECAVVLHKGPYTDLHKTYAYLCGVWGASSGREFGSQAGLEFYLNDPQSTPPEELLTEIWLPLA